MDCQHVRQTPKVFTKSNGAVSVRLQCDDCGIGLQEKPKIGFKLSTLKPFDFELRRRWEEEQRLEWDRTRDEREQELKKEEQRRRDEWFAAYNQHLVSEHWQRIRAEVLHRDHWCQVCFRNPPEQAHHVSYESLKRFGMSFAVECVGVCTVCHNPLHGKTKV